jgi:hypothetical protein
MAIDPCDDRLVAFQHAEHGSLRLGHTGFPCVGIVDRYSGNPRRALSVLQVHYELGSFRLLLLWCSVSWTCYRRF